MNEINKKKKEKKKAMATAAVRLIATAGTKSVLQQQ